MKLADLKVDVERLENGGWVDDIPDLEGVRLKVRGLNNSAWRKLQRKLIEAVPRKKKLNGRIDQDEQDRIQRLCLLQCCLDDWEGLIDDNDQPLPYSKDQARILLFEPEFELFRDAVIWAATVVAEQEKADHDDITKN